MKINKIFVLLLVGISFLWIPTALAKQGERGVRSGNLPYGRWWNNQEVIQELSLSEEQKTQIEKVAIDFRKKVMDLRNESEKLELDLDPIMEAENFNAGAAKEILEKMNKYRSESRLIRGTMFIKIREVLTSEQYAKLKTLKGRRKGRSQGQKKDNRGDMHRRKGDGQRGFHGEGGFRRGGLPEGGPPQTSAEKSWW